MTRKFVKTTPDERKNGWNHITLTAYLESIEKHTLGFMNREPGYVEEIKPVRQNNKYNPHRWRG